jgi:hypothetical protein
MTCGTFFPVQLVSVMVIAPAAMSLCVPIVLATQKVVIVNVVLSITLEIQEMVVNVNVS